jgi:hypothetical protein
VRKYLKQHKLKKYYRYVPLIIHLTTDRPLPVLNHQERDLLLHYFSQVERVYPKHKAAAAKNMIRYSYVIYKLCQLLGYEDFLYYLPLPKCKSKLLENEDIWKAICTTLKWRYIQA